MTEQVFWGWAVSGYMGVTRIVEALVSEGAAPAPETIDELADYADRLDKVVEALRTKQDEARR